VLFWTLLDERHWATGATRHRRNGKIQEGFRGLAIAAYEGEAGCYLFYCDEHWRVLNDTRHASPVEAQAAAEREFSGTIRSWIMQPTMKKEDKSNGE